MKIMCIILVAGAWFFAICAARTAADPGGRKFAAHAFLIAGLLTIAAGIVWKVFPR